MISHPVKIYSGTTAENGDTHASPVVTKYSKEAIIFLDITAIAGTLGLEIQTYNPLTEKWHKLATFDQKSSIGEDEGFIEYGLGEKIALKYTVNGSVTFTLDGNLK